MGSLIGGELLKEVVQDALGAPPPEHKQQLKPKPSAAAGKMDGSRSDDAAVRLKIIQRRVVLSNAYTHMHVRVTLASVHIRTQHPRAHNTF